ncbi:MAG TPA: hypothetical protein VG936_18145 [Lacunisphaera sp.]|nr:hypothetical protein [Lacunisphaera sp.]
MAWRIDEAVVRGEIDNRVRGRVTGRIWFHGQTQPVELELAGNCWRDLAGRRLEFDNPQPKAGDLGKFAPKQKGCVGDMTASRKVKIPDIPMDQIGEYYAARKPWPWHWGNSLYLEWFSERNGRVVIESAAFNLKIVGEPAWEMSAQDETEQRRANGAALTGFMDRLVEAAAASDQPGANTPEWAENPQAEEEAEFQQARSDRLADRIELRLRREGEDAYEKILAEELKRMRHECGDPEPTPEQLARNAEWIEEMNRAADEILANPDPELEKELAMVHPVAERAFELSMRIRREAEDGGWVPGNATQEHPVVELVDSITFAGVKLAGSLNGHEWPPEREICASIIVRLKRARGRLDDALQALECCREQRLIDAARLKVMRGEIEGLVHETDELITELRARLARGCD